MKIHLEFLTPSMHNAGGWKGKPGEQPTAYSAPDVQQSRVAYYIAEVQLPECLREVFQFSPLREGRPLFLSLRPAAADFNSRPCERGDMNPLN